MVKEEAGGEEESTESNLDAAKVRLHSTECKATRPYCWHHAAGKDQASRPNQDQSVRHCRLDGLLPQHRALQLEIV